MKNTLGGLDYGDMTERMSPGVEKYISSPNSLYGTNPAMKNGRKDVQRLVLDRYKKVTNHVKKITGISDLSPEQINMMLFSEMMFGMNQIITIENNHIEKLKKLAIDSCIDEAEISKDWYEFDVHLNSKSIDSSTFNFGDNEDDGNIDDNNIDDEMSFDVDVLTSSESFELEMHKRNIVNAIVQGASKKSHHLFEKPEVKEVLNKIDNRLYPLYRKVFAITDYYYFNAGDTVDRLSQTGTGIIGQNYLEESEEENKDIKITAIATSFPVLCHEIIKGIKESSALHSLPTNPIEAKRVMEKTDLIQNEPIQLRLGPELYERIRMLMPDEMFEEDNKGLMPWFEIVLYRKSAREFLNIISYVVSDDQNKNKLATNEFENILKEAKRLRSNSNN